MRPQYLVLLGAPTPRDAKVESIVRRVAAALHGDDVDVEVVHVHERPDLAAAHKVIATPLIIRTLPLPVRRLVGWPRSPQQLAAGLGYAPGDLTFPPAPTRAGDVA